MRGQKQVVLVLGFVIAVVAGLAGCEFLADNQNNPTASEASSTELTNFGASDEGAFTGSYGFYYREGSGSFLLNVPAGDFLMTYTTDLGMFPTLIRASNDSLMTLYLTPGDILREVVIYEGIVGGMKSAPQQFATQSGPVLFRHLTGTQYASIMANFLVMVGPVTVFANGAVVPGDYNEELTTDDIENAFDQETVVLFSGGGTTGGLGGRSGADSLCHSRDQWKFKHVHAFISVNGSDEIRDMPENYGLPTDRPFISPTGVKIDDNFNDLLDGSIDIGLKVAEVFTDDTTDWWSGSNADGSVAADTCQGWTTSSGSVYGEYGEIDDTDDDWISNSDTSCDDNEDMIILCVGWN